MNSLLHSLRGFKTTVPFTFDEDKMGFDQGKWVEVEQPSTPSVEGATTFQITIGQSADGSKKGYKKGEFGSIDNEYVQLGNDAYEIAQFVVSSSEISLVLASPYAGSAITYTYALKILVAELSGVTSIEDGGNKLTFMEGFEASIYSGNISVGDTSTLTLTPPRN